MGQGSTLEGEDGRLGRLHQSFRAPLLNFFRRRVGEQADAEDLTQDTFVRALAIAEEERIEDPGALLFRIAANLLTDRYRKAGRRRQAQLVDLDTAAVSLISQEFLEEHDPERVFIGRERVAAALRALDELGERTRTIYVLFRLENMTQAEIAAMFGVSKSTVEKTIMKASVHLMKRLARRGR